VFVFILQTKPVSVSCLLSDNTDDIVTNPCNIIVVGTIVTNPIMQYHPTFSTNRNRSWCNGISAPIVTNPCPTRSKTINRFKHCSIRKPCWYSPRWRFSKVLPMVVDGKTRIAATSAGKLHCLWMLGNVLVPTLVYKPWEKGKKSDLYGIISWWCPRKRNRKN